MTTRNEKLALPKPIKSKNPVVILRHVIRAIEQEPRRYDQSTYVERRSGTFRDDDYFPECGTVCCVAGWVNVIAGKPYTNYDKQADTAQQVLHLSGEEAHALFTGNPSGVTLRRRTTAKQHAAEGVKHIKRFVLQKWGQKI